MKKKTRVWVDRRSSDKNAPFLDDVIQSIKKIYLVLFSFAVIFGFAVYSALDFQIASNNLASLDKLLAIRSISIPNNLLVRNAQKSDLTDFFVIARRESFARLDKADDVFSLEAFERRGFTSDRIERAIIMKNVPMRLAIGASCDLLVVPLSAGAEFAAGSLHVVSTIEIVKSEKISFVAFSRCGLSLPEDFIAFLFQLEGGQHILALPSEISFPGLKLSPPFESLKLHRTTEMLERVPSAIGRFVKLNSEYFMVHTKAVDHYILSYMAARLNKYYPPDSIDVGIQSLYEQREQGASLLGLNLNVSSIVQLAPLFVFIVSIELWRKVRSLPLGRLKSKEYWFPFEFSDPIGKIYAYASAVAPLVICVLTFASFPIVFDYSFSIIGGYTFEGLSALRSSFRFIGFDRPSPNFAWFIWCVFVAQAIILFSVTKQLVGLVRNNLRPPDGRELI